MPPPTRASALPQVHILAHSMGARVLAGASQTIADAFKQDVTGPPGGAFTLGSVIMLSPDIELGEFAAHSGPLLRSVCHNVVVYGDEHDSALQYATMSSGLLFKMRPDLAMPDLADNWCAPASVRKSGATMQT